MSIQISRNGQVMGCFELQQIATMLQQGQLLPSDFYWYPGLPQWYSLQVMPELQGLFQQMYSAPQPPVGYYVYQNGVNNRPFTIEQLIPALQSGQLRGSDAVARSDGQGWTTFDQLPEFAAYLQRPAPAATPNYAQTEPQPRTRQVTTRSCGKCGGSGSIGVCPNCRGTTRERTWITPPYTEIDSLNELVKKEQNRTCSQCHGKGSIVCDRCDGSGRETVLA